ncbi:DUF1223 domain-containing protein [Erythrobacter rubeus]|uniref:DUF1223 domain-containing protein n=1 Tax=Erythrobacter rubeus TaxID=2760803 RepID=A0ABR8KQR0_9SPHN|nr:DUF1223 domain-containing protein [Erythrobacter rubeus]MBD2843069.1 DUF1223 domain-containing protein [Erythrobacter rubeus]
MTKFSLALLTAIAALSAFSFGLAIPGNAQIDRSPAGGEPVLIELFTSQGCSSCPPADRLANRLESEPGLVVISKPVDYWDRLGWKDTFASPENTALQRAYARRGLEGYDGVYTPQSVIAGGYGEVGSDERAIRNSVRAAARQQTSAIRVRGNGDTGYAIGIAGPAGTMGELVLVGVESSPTVAIERGENRGRNVTYANVLVGERVVSRWSGGKASHVIRRGDLGMPRADRYTLLLRERAGGAVLAAQWLER